MRIHTVIVLLGIGYLAGTNEVMAATAGKVIYAHGEAQVQDASGQSRALRKGDEVAAGQTLVTQNGRLQVRFSDGGFVAMQPATQFRVDEYRYAGQEDGSERSFFNLVKGGVRFVTGAIGNKNKQNYKIKTAVATIGIRGSAGLSVMCVGGSCPGRADGLYLTGNQDTLTLENETGIQDVQPGETYHVKCESCDAKQVEQSPDAHVDVESEEEKLAEEGEGEDGEEAIEEFIADTSGETLPEFTAGEERDSSGQLVGVGTVAGNISFRTVAQTSLFNTIDDVPSGFSNFNNVFFQETGFTSVTLSSNALLAYEIQEQFRGLTNVSTFDSGSATLTDGGSSAAAGGVFWGRWVGNYSASFSSAQGPGSPVGNEPGGFHFMFGSSFSGDLATLQSTIGSATYTAVGGTSPTDQIGAIGIFQGGQISVDFSTAAVNGNFDVLMPSGEQFAATFTGGLTPGFPGNGARINAPALGGTCINGSCSAGVPISGRLNGGFTGSAAQGLITNYIMSGGSETVIGTQAYAR